MPLEDTTIKVKVEDAAVSVIDQLRAASEELAKQQNSRVIEGVPLKSVAASKIITEEENIEDAEIIEEIPKPAGNKKWSLTDV